MKRHVIQKITIIAESVVHQALKTESPEFAQLLVGNKVNPAGDPQTIITSAREGQVRFAVTQIETVHDHPADDQSDFNKRTYWTERW